GAERNLDVDYPGARSTDLSVPGPCHFERESALGKNLDRIFRRQGAGTSPAADRFRSATIGVGSNREIARLHHRAAAIVWLDSDRAAIHRPNSARARSVREFDRALWKQTKSQRSLFVVRTLRHKNLRRVSVCRRE